MNLTGKQLVEKGIVFQTFPDILPEENIAQHGVDCNLIRVRKIEGNGFIPVTGKTKLGNYIQIPTTEIDIIEGDEPKRTTHVWNLEPGVYDITLAQGCKIPIDQRLELVQRSSLLRNGAMIVSSLFDAGFETKNMGTVMHVRVPISIEVGARVCQAYCSASNDVKNLYDGQFQKDSQRIDGRESKEC